MIKFSYLYVYIPHGVYIYNCMQYRIQTDISRYDWSSYVYNISYAYIPTYYSNKYYAYDNHKYDTEIIS